MLQMLQMLQRVAVCCRGPCVAGLTSDAVCCRPHVASVEVLQCVAVCCSVLQCVAVCCSVLQCVAVCCRVLQASSRCYSQHRLDVRAWRIHVLQRVAVCCSVLQRVAACCRPKSPSISARPQCTGAANSCVAVVCSVLQCVAVHCSVLQYVADLKPPSFSARPPCRGDVAANSKLAVKEGLVDDKAAM